MLPEWWTMYLRRVWVEWREVGDFSYVTVHIQRSNINILRASANLQQRPIVMLVKQNSTPVESTCMTFTR